MKKRILLMVAMIAMLVCLFAISASAKRVENYDATFTLAETSNITHYERHYYSETSYHKRAYTDTISVSFVDENGDKIISVPMWEYDEEDGKYYSLVWYISAWEFTKEDTTTTISDVEYTFDKYTSAKYILKKARAVDIRFDHTYTESWTYKTDKVGYNYEYKVQSPLWGMFLDLNNTPDDLTDDYKLQQSTGMGRDTSDYGYIGWEAQFAGTGNKIVVANLRDCNFDADCTGNYGTKNTWTLATNLQCLWYPDTLKYMVGGVSSSVRELDLGDGIEIIACQVLRDNKNVKEIIIPNSVLFLNDEAFRGTDLTKLTIGEGLLNHGDNNQFLYTGGADIVVLSKNLLNSTYTGKANALISNTSATVYFDGNKEQAEALMAKIIAENNGYNGKITLIDYSVTQDRGETKNVALFYNYNTCEAFYRGEHIDNGNACVFACEICDSYDGNMRDEPKHNYTNVIEYTNYLANGTKTQTCQNEGCVHAKEPNAVEVAPIISSFKGISTKENGDGLTFGYIINHDALDEYVAVNGSNVELGFVVAVKHFLGDEQPLDANGDKSSDKVIKVEIYNSSTQTEGKIKYTGADFKLTGNWSKTVDLDGDGELDTDIKDVVFYMAGYIIVGGEMSFINNGESGNTADSFYYNQF